ncbi:alpha/beta fold hydrolase [Peterkaempfera griseoplana]|uniref:alpha/beta fold hydrolase n=1 Tax=Peterkaempfera griseoplana TaxID=66896 RepID=UPI0006E1EFF7|nr:alpha/beta hydrolase [Peterkaempfera griseoplana]
MTTGTAQPDTANHPMPTAPGVTHRWVTAGGVRFHLAEAGAGGDPLLLLHTFPQHWYAWHRVLPLLTRDHRLICPDLRGAGWSDAPSHGYDTDTRVADILALLDAIGLDRVGLIGHGWGGWLGFMLCLRDPGRFTHHLALNSIHPWPLHRRLAPNAWRYWHTAPLETPLVGRAVLRHLPGFTQGLLRRRTADPSVWTSQELEEYAHTAGRPGHDRAGELLNRAYALHDIPRLVRGHYKQLRLTTPTVLLAGERDVTLPPAVMTDPGRYAEELQIRIVPGVGSHLPQEQPELIAESARALFRG